MTMRCLCRFPGELSNCRYPDCKTFMTLGMDEQPARAEKGVFYAPAHSPTPRQRRITLACFVARSRTR